MTPAELAARLGTWPQYARVMVGDATALGYAHLQGTTPLRTGQLRESEHVSVETTGEHGTIDVLAPYAEHVKVRGSHNQVPNEYVQAGAAAAVPDVEARLAVIGDAYFRGSIP